MKYDLAMTFRKENFGQQNFGESLVIHQICLTFLPPKYVSYDNIIIYIMIYALATTYTSPQSGYLTMYFYACLVIKVLVLS